MCFNDNDRLARWLFSPKDAYSILNKKHNLIRIISDNFQFNDANERKESVNNLNLYPDKAEDRCHSFGVQAVEASNLNRQMRAEKTGKSPSFQTYTGFTVANYNEVLNVSDNNIGFEVHHFEENGNIAHCNIHMLLKPPTQEMSRSEVKKYKNASRSKLSDKFNRITPYTMEP